MARNYKATTITIHTELLAQFKDYCTKTKLPLSRFFSLAAQEKIQKENKEETQ